MSGLSILFKVIKWSVAVIALLSYKTVPFAYYFRFYSVVIKNLIFPYRRWIKEGNRKPHSELDVFHTTTVSTFVSIFECDFYLHKSNSTYFEELDISRTNLMTTVFRDLFFKYQRDALGGSKKDSIFNWPYIPVATVSASFRRQLSPFEKYTIEDGILCWDDKWIFILSRFINKSNKVCTTCVTKYVLKNGKKTIRPKDALADIGLWNERVQQISQSRLHLIESYVDQSELESLDLSH
ncbi:BA75_04114T0 [Komagataella pastoris]|uniref:BA75_04114T0 n=1 Tax=Komagataella pastoris TaxID=4922 RepID=A0A1B2JFE2_PICPA|nr:BA75_04114T0 [Komagataella pastoris]